MRLWCVVMGLTVIGFGPAEVRAQDVTWGLKGGVVFGSLDVEGPDAFDTSPDAGGLIGGFVGIGLGRHVRVQPEVYWSVRRFSADDVLTPFTVSTRGVELPVLLQARFPEDRSTQALVYGGPQVSFVGSVTQEAGGRSTDIGEQIKDVDFGVVFGAGLEHRMSRGAWLLELRAVIGTSNLRERGDGAFRSRAIQVLVGYRF